MEVLEVHQKYFHLSYWAFVFFSECQTEWRYFIRAICIWSRISNSNMPENMEALLSLLFWKAKPHFPPLRQDGKGTAAVFISVGAARSATQCGLFGPELGVFLLWQMGTCEENVVQLRPNFPVTIALALWPWGEAGSQGGALWVMLFTHVWKGTCGNIHGQLT